MAEENKDYLVEMKKGEEIEAEVQNIQKLMNEIEKLLPDVEHIISGSARKKA